MAASYWLFMLSTFTYFLARLLYPSKKAEGENKPQA